MTQHSGCSRTAGCLHHLVVLHASCVVGDKDRCFLFCKRLGSSNVASYNGGCAVPACGNLKIHVSRDTWLEAVAGDTRAPAL